MKLTCLFLCLISPGLAPAQTTLREAAAQRAIAIGAAANADEFGIPNRLNETAYANALATQFNMLEPENAMKWNPIHPSQNTYNFAPADQLASFAAARGMLVRGHTLAWHSNNPSWLDTFAKTATPAAMAAVLKDHIDTVMGHYRGQVFAWDVVNEAVPDSATGVGTQLRDSIWNNQPGIGASGTGFIEQAFRWARGADPNALLFYNDYHIEGGGAKFQAVLDMAKDFVARGVPLNGIGLQMHLTNNGFPSADALTQVIRQITALGLQVHITEMDVRLKVDGGAPSATDLQLQAQAFQRVLTVCLQNPGCTALQTWGFTDKYSWIPEFFQGFGAALPLDASYQPKLAVDAMLDTLRSTPPQLAAASVVNAASYKGGAVAPGELVTIFGANYGPGALVGAQLDTNGLVSANLAGTQVFFDGVGAPFIYAVAGQVSVVVPYEVAGKQQTVVQYVYNGVKSNTVTIPVAPSAPGVFAANATGKGPGLVLNADYTLNTDSAPATAGSAVQILATGGGTVKSGAVNGALAAGAGEQTLAVTATIGGVNAPVVYAGPAPGLVNGVMQVNAVVPAGLGTGPQALVVTVGGVRSDAGVTVAVK